MKLGDVVDLPPTLDTHQAAELLGVGVDHLWRLARQRSAPVEPLRLGRALRWPTKPLLERLGLDAGVRYPPTPEVVDLRQRGAGDAA